MNEHDAHIPDEDLLAALTDERSSPRHSAIALHVASCVTCARRAATLSCLADEVTAALRSEPGSRALDDARMRLRTALRCQPNPQRLYLRRALSAAFALAAVFVATVWIRPIAGRPGDVDLASRPVAALTPGAAAITRADEVCAEDRSADVPIPASIRQQVIASYGMQDVPEQEYELDYLITPELGGALDPRNLWPQRYTAAGPWNALVKDELERLLPRLVCNGRLELQVAQRDMAADWVAAYRKYFRTKYPLRTHVRAGSAGGEDANGLRVLGILPPESGLQFVPVRFNP
jgi:anti-sigma factor RsiW